MADIKYVKARGLPWSASAEEVIEFFTSCQVVGGATGVHFISNYDGRPSGTCYLELESQADLDAALARDKDKMGKRYIEVFEATAAELEVDLCRRQGAGGDAGTLGGEVGEDAVVKLRGLPFSASKLDITDFFAGLEIESNGILVVTDFEGRPKGEAFVQFTTTAGAERAQEKNKQNMGHRYIEVFMSSMEEAKRAQTQMAFGAMGGGGRGGAGGPMRGGMMSQGGGMMRPGPYDRMGGYGMGGGLPRGGGGGGGMRAGGFYGGGGYPGRGGGMGMRGGGGGGGMGMRSAGGMFVVKMRGLPFRASEQDIAEWFSSVADPVDVFIRFNQEGRPSGEAEVTFATEGEAKRALIKNKQNMQNRYIELFLVQY